MSIEPDNILVRQRDRSEIWWIQSGMRCWVPDSETVGSKGGWQAVKVLPVGQTIDNPIGPIVQSVVTQAWADGTLIAAWPEPRVYVMQGGKKNWITSSQVFTAYGYNWNQIRVISSVEMNAIPEGPPDYGPTPGAVPPELNVNTGRQFLNAGHYMETNAKFTRADGVVAGGTTTETITLLGGFHGGVYGILADAGGVPVPGGQSPLYRYGVDGTLIGNSKRTDGWSFPSNPTQAVNVHSLSIFQIWAPDQFLIIMGRWAQAGQTVAQLAQQVGTIAAVFA
jgi:hypothetical protein